MGLFHPKISDKQLNTKAIGERSEAAVISRLIDCGYVVLVPFGDNQRYDLVIEDAERQFWRVQVKTGRLEKNGECIEYNASSNLWKNGSYNSKRDYVDQADYFGIYCRELNKVYLVPAAHAGKYESVLRLIEPKRGKMKTMRWAVDYEL